MNRLDPYHAIRRFWRYAPPQHVFLV